MAQLIKNYGKVDIGVSINRSNGQPMDPTEIWYDLDALKAYAKTNQAYVGQKVTYIDADGNTHHYEIVGEGENGTIQSYSTGDGGGTTFTTDETLTLSNGVLSVNTTDTPEADNTLPITAGAVYAQLGNIEVLLKTI